MRHYAQYVIAVAVLMAVSAPLALAEIQNARALQTVKVFRNVSGATRNHGDAMVFQTRNNDTNITIGVGASDASSLGMDITTVTSADSENFVGCVLADSCLDDQLCTVVVAGPAICKWAGSTDNTDTRGASVGTTTVAGNVGAGSRVGSLMSLSLQVADTEVNGQLDNESRWIWLNPDNSSP